MFVFFINVMLSVRPTQAWELIGSVVDRVITLPPVAKVGQKSDRFNEDKMVSQVRVSSSNVCVCWKFLLMIISFNLVPPVWCKIYGRILGQELTTLVSQKFLHSNAFNRNFMIGFKDKTS